MLDSHTADISRASCHQDRHAIPLFSSMTLEVSRADESNAKNALSAIDIHLNVGPRLRAGHDTIYRSDFCSIRYHRVRGVAVSSDRIRRLLRWEDED
jgi:hypothetical protein